jgi:hypothetical protein
VLMIGIFAADARKALDAKLLLIALGKGCWPVFTILKLWSKAVVPMTSCDPRLTHNGLYMHV